MTKLIKYGCKAIMKQEYGKTLYNFGRPSGVEVVQLPSLLLEREDS
jgi:hypothetical protein